MNKVSISSDIVRRLAIVAIGLAIALGVGPLSLFGEYFSFLIVSIGTYMIAVLALTMLAGLSGIWSMGHAAFMAIGAYSLAGLAGFSVPIEGIIAAGMIISAIVGFALGLCAGRFSLLYFGLLTLALSLTATEIITSWRSVTGGIDGVSVPPIYSLLAGRDLSITDGPVLTITLATLVYLAVDWVSASSLGRRWLAVKSQRMASMAIGVVPHRENALTMAISGALASVAGVCAAVSVGYLEPTTFSLHSGIYLIVATVVGGAGSYLGALVGSAFLVLVPELARGNPDISPFIFGAATILMLLFLRRGIVPTLTALCRRLFRRTASARLTKPAPAETAIGNMSNIDPLLTRATAPLTVSHLSVSFGGVKALSDVSLTLQPGKALGLIGPNGAGKTTLLNVLSGYVKATDAEEISLGDVDLGKLDPWDRIKLGLGRSFQHAELFGELTVREIFRVAATQNRHRGADEKHSELHAGTIADRVLAALELEHLARAYPAELSFGTRKIVDIGRLLCAGASVVILDEPFSGLDAGETLELRRVLDEMRKGGVSILIIDHVIAEVFRIVDEIVVLDFGKVLMTGTPQAVAANENVRAAYFGDLGAPAMEAV